MFFLGDSGCGQVEGKKRHLKRFGSEVFGDEPRDGTKTVQLQTTIGHNANRSNSSRNSSAMFVSSQLFATLDEAFSPAEVAVLPSQSRPTAPRSYMKREGEAR